ncbi:pyridoxal phosphate homeostasis protein [Lachnospiraceae bacterium]|jgi:pyridoxal phosphate enzyme (YggS family)|nr:YggS family pyridoxal phosphate-dependent enzyme [Lachnospiraceae bacterium]GFI66064.1 pyridoxal phosphate homeostasis protein [Lachnospiraceae bacterium]
MIRENLADVEKRIEEACSRRGRDRSQVTLTAVSKTKPLELLREAYAAGIRDFGENKVQELTEKIPCMPPDVRWHMIGHLQRNKVKYIVDQVYMIHSVDSLRLAEEISREAVKKQVTVRILIEVNMAGEESKFGVRQEELISLVQEAAKLPGIRIMGLMTVAPYVENAEDNRLVFRNLKQLSVDIASKNIDNVSMDILSMGMTGDYAVAIEEGATCVRVGTGIFGQRDYTNRRPDI